MKQQKVILADQCADIGWALTEVLAQSMTTSLVIKWKPGRAP